MIFSWIIYYTLYWLLLFSLLDYVSQHAVHIGHIYFMLGIHIFRLMQRR